MKNLRNLSISKGPFNLMMAFLLVALLNGCKPPETTSIAPSTTESVVSNPKSTETLSSPNPEQSMTPLETQIPMPETLEKPMFEPGGALYQTDLEPSKTIVVTAISPNAESYEWSLDGPGEISSTGPGDKIRYTAPNQGGVSAIINVKAHKGKIVSPVGSLTLNITQIIASALRLDAIGIPAGFMSGGSNPADYLKLNRGNQSICHTGADCIQVIYRPGGMWGGIYWWPPACGGSGTPDAWNKVRDGSCKVDLLKMGSFTKIDRLTFWVKGETGAEVVEFKIGGVDVLPSPGKSMGSVNLTTGWQQKEISMEGVDLTGAVGVFLFVAADLYNPNGAIFYLDDIQFEGAE